MTESVRPVAPTLAPTDDIPAALSRNNLTDLEAATPLNFDAVLKMRHFAELESRVAAGEIIPREEMAARFLPTESDYQVVAQWMREQGLTVNVPGASHAVVTASGTPRQLARAFQTNFARVAFRGAEYTAATGAPSVPAEIEARVSGVHGLQPYLHPHHSGVIKKDAVSATDAPPYTVSDILTAYNVADSGLTGAGQQIGIIIDTIPRATDLAKFWSDNGINPSANNVITVNVDGGSLPAPSGEETLDVSWASGLAPGAQIVIYACGDLDNVNDAYSRILDDLQEGSRPSLHQISMSYGAGEITDETPGDMRSTHQMFTAIAAYGVSLFSSSGDNGMCGNGGKTVQAVYPASDPNVTGVGGTSLRLSYGSGTIASETAWSPGSSSAHGSSGGGVSAYFARPSWQTGATVPSGTMRLVPDVAFAADPDNGCYLIYNGQVVQYGGTSWGAPSWAALCALLNQSRAVAGLTPLGTLNASLYPLLGKSAFHDITDSQNGDGASTVGYDLITGLGSPDYGALANALLGNSTAATVQAPVITSATAASGTVGTAFGYQITASNSPTGFAASGLPAGCTVDAASGLISGLPTVAGTFTVTPSASNGGGTGTGALTITIAAPTVPAVTLPVVTLTTTVPQAIVSTVQRGEATLTIPTALSTDLFVYYSVTGSATNGADYVYLKGRAKMKAGRTSKIIKVVPLGSLDDSPRKSVMISLDPGSDYSVGLTGTAQITILEN